MEVRITAELDFPRGALINSAIIIIAESLHCSKHMGSSSAAAQAWQTHNFCASFLFTLAGTAAELDLLFCALMHPATASHSAAALYRPYSVLKCNHGLLGWSH